MVSRYLFLCPELIFPGHIISQIMRISRHSFSKFGKIPRIIFQPAVHSLPRPDSNFKCLFLSSANRDKCFFVKPDTSLPQHLSVGISVVAIILTIAGLFCIALVLVFLVVIMKQFCTACQKQRAYDTLN